jgi:hypothetical protein
MQSLRGELNLLVIVTIEPEEHQVCMTTVISSKYGVPSEWVVRELWFGLRYTLWPVSVSSKGV